MTVLLTSSFWILWMLAAVYDGVTYGLVSRKCAPKLQCLLCTWHYGHVMWMSSMNGVKRMTLILKVMLLPQMQWLPIHHAPVGQFLYRLRLVCCHYHSVLFLQENTVSTSCQPKVHSRPLWEWEERIPNPVSPSTSEWPVLVQAQPLGHLWSCQ